VILTNPPYVTKGSGVYKEEVKEAGVGDNNVDLGEYYDRCGLGVESFFLRYISGALKLGGRAFVIVPLGLLDRTDPGPKKRILDECNVVASIALPRNTFFNTAQLTYILALEKRHTVTDPRPDVFCGIARTIGETLNWERVPTPKENDLADIALRFVRHINGDTNATKGSHIAKVTSSSSFTENDRWDVSRFWTEDELVALGQKESAVSRVDFIDEAKTELEEIATELASARAEFVALTSGPVVMVRLGDETSFDVRSGTRVTGKEIRENPGNLPIYSCFRTELEIKGNVDEKFFEKVKKGTIENKTTGKAIVTVNANGASVGRVYVRRDRCGITDDVSVVELKRDDIDYDYLSVALQAAVDKGGLLYEAKLFVTRAKDLEIEVPGSGSKLDLEQQKAIARAVRRFDALRTRLHDLGVRSGTVRAI
jgi:type I restriction enzyme M protein